MIKQNIFLAVCLLFGGYSAALSAVIYAPFPVKLTAVPDHHVRGIELSNVYRFTVNFAQIKYATTNRYAIMYYEDGRPLDEFKDKVLPFEFKRSYKGISAGAHVIRVDVEDGKGTVLGTDATQINVLYKGG